MRWVAKMEAVNKKMAWESQMDDKKAEESKTEEVKQVDGSPLKAGC